MVGKFVCFFCCLMIAFAFFSMGFGGKDRMDPINYFSGDETLKDKVKDLKNYNAEMSRMYKYWALAWVVVGALYFPLPISAGVAVMIIALGVETIITYRVHKNILKKYS